MQHEEIIIIRTRIQITIEQAKLICRQQNPQYQKIYAEVIQARKSDVKIAEGRQGFVVECGGGSGQMGAVTMGDKSQSNKEKENEEKPTHASDVVCISPVSGSMCTKTVELTDQVSTQDEDGTSECNPVLRAESQNIFEEYRSGMEYEDH